MICGLLGEKLSHSYSPIIHSTLGDYEYRLFEVAPENLESFVKSGEFDAINVTIPYKKAVLPYLTDMSDRAKKIGSVNVVRRLPDGGLYGDNTDYAGFKSLVLTSKINVRGKKVLVLGSGGASVAVCAVLHDLKAKSVLVISRSGEDNYENISRHFDADVIVNTTPVGMYPNNGESPLSLEGFKHLLGVIDIIYNPLKTALVLEAEERGIPAVGGLHMLVAQAVYAYEAFGCGTYSYDKCRRAEQMLLNQMRNIVLVGMPGSGKSVIGRRVAKYLDRPFVDLDAMIEERAGKTIPQIFEDEGEEAFRALETECAAEVGKKSGLIISTGGGIITRKRNKAPMKQNGTVVWIFRNLDNLATKNRPILQTVGARELAKQRLPLYKDWADVKMYNGGVAPTVSNLIRFLHLKKAKDNKNEKADNN